MKRFVVHVYLVNGSPEERLFILEQAATGFAKERFKDSDVYKVKVWDIEKGSFEQNNPNAAGLILHLV